MMVARHSCACGVNPRLITGHRRDTIDTTLLIGIIVKLLMSCCVARDVVPDAIGIVSVVNIVASIGVIRQIVRAVLSSVILILGD